MKSDSIIYAGSIPNDLEDFENRRELLRSSKPMKVKDFYIRAYKDIYNDCLYEIHADNKIYGLNALINFLDTDSILEWLEGICLGYFNNYYVTCEEGPETLIIAKKINEQELRFSIIGTSEIHYNHNINRYKIADLREDKEASPYVLRLDTIIDKNLLIQEFYNATKYYLSKMEEDDFDFGLPKYSSEIIISYLHPCSLSATLN